MSRLTYRPHGEKGANMLTNITDTALRMAVQQVADETGLPEHDLIRFDGGTGLERGYYRRTIPQCVGIVTKSSRRQRGELYLLGNFPLSTYYGALRMYFTLDNRVRALLGLGNQNGEGSKYL